MRLKNTSALPTSLVRDLIRFAKPSGISNFDVMAKKSSGSFYGRAYGQGSGYHSTANPFVVVRIGKNKYPFRVDRDKGRGYLPVTAYSQTELFLHVLAHELRHLWQAKHPKGWRVWGAKGQFSERDADAYAINVVRRYRREV